MTVMQLLSLCVFCFCCGGFFILSVTAYDLGLPAWRRNAIQSAVCAIAAGVIAVMGAQG